MKNFYLGELKYLSACLVGFGFDIETIAKFYASSFGCENYYNDPDFLLCPLKKEKKCTNKVTCIDNFKHYILQCIENSKE